MATSTLRARVFPAALAAAAAAENSQALHDVRASLATVAALGCGIYGHVRLRPWRARSPDSPFLPARLVPCAELEAGGHHGVLLVAAEAVLDALGLAVGAGVEVETVDPGIDAAAPAGAAAAITLCRSRLAPEDGSCANGIPMSPPGRVLNRAARGLVLPPGALLLVRHLGLTQAYTVIEASPGGAAVVCDARTEVKLATAAPTAMAKQREPSADEESVEEGSKTPGFAYALLEETLGILRVAASSASDIPPLLRMRGLVLAGPRGAGKTHLLRRLGRQLSAAEAAVRVAHVRGEDVHAIVAAGGEGEDGSEAGAARLHRLITGQNGARDRREDQPVVLLLDDADALLLPAGGGHDADDGDDDGDGDDGGRLGRDPALRALLRYLLGGDGGGGGRPCCWVLATRGAVGGGGATGAGGSGGGGGSGRLARRLAALQVAGLFDKALELPTPTAQERASLLASMLRAVALDGEQQLLVERVAETTGGFLPGDLRRLCRAAGLQALGRAAAVQGEGEAAPALTWSDFRAARAEVRPAALGGVPLSSAAGASEHQQQLSWATVGGYEEVKARLRRLIEWPLKYAASFARLGIPGHPPGILLHGPSGCGKSLLARVLAAEAKANFVELPAAEVFSAFLGDSEARLRAVFARARRAAPCILFIDELDAMAAERESVAEGGGDGTGGVYVRVLSTLLNEMDGISSTGAGGGLVVLAATNRLEAVDAALLRPGRLQEVLLVPPPRPQEDYAPILRVATRRMPLGPDVDLDALVRDRLAPVAKTDGDPKITPATLAAVAREAALECLRERVGAAGEGQGQGEEEGLVVAQRHFARAVDKVLTG